MHDSVKETLKNAGILLLHSDNIAAGQRIPICPGMDGIILGIPGVMEGGAGFAESCTERRKED